MAYKMFEKPKILAMIQPHALPGTYLNNGEDINYILEKVMEEASTLEKIGFDGFIIQNMHDGPIKQVSNPETIAFMTVITKEIKRKFPGMLLGVLVNWDGIASLAVAEACQADFVRVEHLYTGASVGLSGIIEGQCYQILELKKKLHSNTPIFADVQEVNGNYILPIEKDKDAIRVVKRAFADGIFLGGKSTEESIELIKKIRPRLPNIPIILGGGATGDNIYELMKYYDGVSVATWIKDGDMRNPINLDKAKLFLENAKRGISEREM